MSAKNLVAKWGRNRDEEVKPEIKKSAEIIVQRRLINSKYTEVKKCVKYIQNIFKTLNEHCFQLSFTVDKSRSWLSAGKWKKKGWMIKDRYAFIMHCEISEHVTSFRDISGHLLHMLHVCLCREKLNVPRIKSRCWFWSGQLYFSLWRAVMLTQVCILFTIL